MPGRRRLPFTARWTAAIGAAIVVAALAVIATALIAGRSPSCGNPVWGQLQGDPAHDGSAQGGGGTLKVRWTRSGDASGGLVLVGDEVLVSGKGGVAGLSTDDGKVRWHWSPADGKGSNVGPGAVHGCSIAVVEARPDRPTSGVHGILHVVSLTSHEPISRSLDIPSVSAGGLLSGSSSFEVVGARPVSGGFDWGLFAVNPDDGKTIRLTTVGAFAPGPPAADGDNSFVAAWDSSVRSVNNTGRELWRTATAALPLTTPVISGGRVIVGTIGGVEAFDAGTGKVLWTTPVTSGVVVAPLPTGDAVLVVDRTSHKLHHLDAATGRESWATQLGATLSPPVAVGSRILTADETGELLAIDAGSGKVLQRLTLKSGVRNPLAVGGGSLYAVGNDGGVTAVSLG
jgi:outer membrane protein assembly factor BamB